MQFFVQIVSLYNWLLNNSRFYITSTCVDTEDGDGQIILGTWRCWENKANKHGIVMKRN